VPKGLRSFDAEDADFFLDLLPGPRDRDGLPDSIRFWKTRLEETDPNRTFSVGLMYGPSGCGKSSLIKAGLLPRLLASVIPIYVEATADDTEARLVKSVRRHFPKLAENLPLPEALARLRQPNALPAGMKVVIILDQFEQWLHAGRQGQTTALVEALRQCDGQHVQCVLMVRDDFWLAVSRFLRDLEIRLVEGQNMALIDLFDPLHARKVLAEFGRAFGRLPAHPAPLSAPQERFLDQAVAELTQEGKVVSVRLSLLAELVKTKPWTPATLKAVGGTEGLRVTYFEETFSAAGAPPEHRLHRNAVQAVLKILLPEPGADIKGHMRSSQELLLASGYGGRLDAFEDLLRILDNGLRLVTPTDPEGKEDGDSSLIPHPSSLLSSLIPHPSSLRYYQLTHDYLVSSLREWLTRKQRETLRGRAALLCEERAREWIRSRQNRVLPSAVEFARIVILTRRATWSADSRAMMRRALWVHGTRVLSSAALVTGLAALAALVILNMPRAIDTFSSDQADPRARLKAFAALDLNDAVLVKRVIQVLENESRSEVAVPVLEALAKQLRSHQGPEFIAVLQKLARRPALHVSIRLAAFEALTKVDGHLDIVATIQQLLLDNDPPDALCERMLAYLKTEADRLTIDTISAPGNPLRDAIVTLAEAIVKQPSSRLRPQAFRIFAMLAPVDQVMSLVTAQGSNSNDSRLKEEMVLYIQSIDLPGLEDEARLKAIQGTMALLRTRENDELVRTCLKLLDRQPLDHLCRWLREAFPMKDAKENAQEGILRYAGRTGKERLRRIGEYIETRLEELVKTETDKEIRTSYELEYLVHAIGQFRAISSDLHFAGARKVITHLLQNRGLLEDKRILDTIIESYGELSDPDHAQLDALREILVDEKSGVEARLTAARILGKLPQLESLPVIRDTATSAKLPPIVREAAIKSLGELGAHLKRRKEPVQEIKEVLQQLINRSAEEQRELVRKAIAAFGEIADPTDARFLFERLNDRNYNASAMIAIHAIIQSAPQTCRQAVEDFLEWRVGIARDEPELQYPLDEALVGVSSRYGLDATPETRLAALKGVAQALATAQQNRKREVRRLAARFLGDILPDPYPFKLDPLAEDGARAVQLEQWNHWWQENHHELRLQGGSLTSR
jgi:hypothetical protein